MVANTYSEVDYGEYELFISGRGNAKIVGAERFRRGRLTRTGDKS